MEILQNSLDEMVFTILMSHQRPLSLDEIVKQLIELTGVSKYKSLVKSLSNNAYECILDSRLWTKRENI